MLLCRLHGNENVFQGFASFCVVGCIRLIFDLNYLDKCCSSSCFGASTTMVPAKQKRKKTTIVDVDLGLEESFPNKQPSGAQFEGDMTGELRAAAFTGRATSSKYRGECIVRGREDEKLKGKPACRQHCRSYVAMRYQFVGFRDEGDLEVSECWEELAKDEAALSEEFHIFSQDNPTFSRYKGKTHFDVLAFKRRYSKRIAKVRIIQCKFMTTKVFLYLVQQIWIQRPSAKFVLERFGEGPLFKRDFSGPAGQEALYIPKGQIREIRIDDAKNVILDEEGQRLKEYNQSGGEQMTRYTHSQDLSFSVEFFRRTQDVPAFIGFIKDKEKRGKKRNVEDGFGVDGFPSKLPKMHIEHEKQIGQMNFDVTQCVRNSEGVLALIDSC